MCWGGGRAFRIGIGIPPPPALRRAWAAQRASESCGPASRWARGAESSGSASRVCARGSVRSHARDRGAQVRRSICTRRVVRGWNWLEFIFVVTGIIALNISDGGSGFSVLCVRGRERGDWGTDAWESGSSELGDARGREECAQPGGRFTGLCPVKPMFVGNMLRRWPRGSDWFGRGTEDAERPERSAGGLPGSLGSPPRPPRLRGSLSSAACFASFFWRRFCASPCPAIQT